MRTLGESEFETDSDGELSTDSLFGKPRSPSKLISEKKAFEALIQQINEFL